jgi:hypothetical protein
MALKSFVSKLRDFVPKKQGLVPALRGFDPDMKDFFANMKSFAGANPLNPQISRINADFLDFTGVIGG